MNDIPEIETEPVEVEFSDGEKRVYDFPTDAGASELKQWCKDTFNEMFPNIDEIMRLP